MSDSKPFVLVTNRFDESLKLNLKTFSQCHFVYVKNIYDDVSLLSQAEGLIIRSSSKIDKDFLEKASKLKYVVSATSGFDHIDLDAANNNNVRCFHVPETQSVAAAELTVFLMFAACRKFTLANQQLHKGDWQRELLLGRQLAGQSLGIIGLGRVGKQVAERALALGLKVSAFDPYIQDHDTRIPMLGFEELLRSSDIVSLHVPKTSKTRHMIKKDTLECMNTEAILINMSRGDVVNEYELIDHLMENPNFLAGLDVFAKEPLVTKSKLLELPNVVLTPHIGASTERALKDSSRAALDKVLALFKGEAVQGALPPKALWYGE